MTPIIITEPEDWVPLADGPGSVHIVAEQEGALRLATGTPTAPPLDIVRGAAVDANVGSAWQISEGERLYARTRYTVARADYVAEHPLRDGVTE